MKEIKRPLNLEECTKAERIPKKWWSIACGVDIVGGTVMLLIITIGLAAVIVGGAFLYGTGVTNVPVTFAITFGSWIGVALIAIIEFCVYKFTALILFTVSKRTYNSDVLAKNAVYNSEQAECAEEGVCE